jgi:hypothetical protein
MKGVSRMQLAPNALPPLLVRESIRGQKWMHPHEGVGVCLCLESVQCKGVGVCLCLWSVQCAKGWVCA